MVSSSSDDTEILEQADSKPSNNTNRIKLLENLKIFINLGVILWKEIPFPSFKKGAAVSIATISNGRICGPLAVGRALLSSDSILASGMKGRGVEILHLFKDQLW